MEYHSGWIYFPHFLNIENFSTPVIIVLLVSFVILLGLSFLAAGAEVAFFSLDNKDINILKTRKNPSYRRIVSLLEEPGLLMGSMLIANSILNMGIILVANLLLDNWLPLSLTFWGAFTIKFFIIALVLILFAEILPKIWATQHKIRFASSSSLMVDICNSLFYNFSKRWMRYQQSMEHRFAAFNHPDQSNIEMEIDLLPDEKANPEEKLILKGIQKFSNTEVKQIMRTRMDVSGVQLQATFAEVLEKVQELHYSRLPVYENNLDAISGMLHTKDLIPHLEEAADFNWHPLMRAPYFIHEQKSIEDLLQEFRNKRIHFAVVVDEFGGTSGIVTLEDIMEEIIGDIKDEFDDEESINKKIDDFNFIFEGKLMINDACSAMGIPVNSFDGIRGESDSVAGLVLEIAGEFPKENEVLEHGNFTFIPLEINKNRIDKIKVTIQPKSIEA